MSSKAIIAVLIAIIVLAGGYWMYTRNQAPQDNQAELMPVNDSPDALQAELEAIDVNADIDTQFQEVDANIQSL